jgi:hypothetical protein
MYTNCEGPPATQATFHVRRRVRPCSEEAAQQLRADPDRCSPPFSREVHLEVGSGVAAAAEHAALHGVDERALHADRCRL